MGKNKYDTNVKPRLAEIEAWARDGVPEKQMIKALGVSVDAFYRYKKEHNELKDILARTKDYVDKVEMVGAYKRRAEGRHQSHSLHIILAPARLCHELLSDAVFPLL